jgi:glycerol-3-phosphate dehydrogenase
VGTEPSIAGEALGPRDAAIERLASTRESPLDLLVVGGGITGAGVALDAASRGMKVGLAERLDFASGTSSKSSKLVHGGLRYLEQREFGLVREATAERDLLGRLAPHLVEALPFVIPISSRWRRAMFGVGLWTYDALASFRNLRVHRHLDIDTTEKMVPPLPRGKLQGGFLFYDSKTDDVRLVMEVLIQARRHGAVVANYARVLDLSGGDAECSAVVEDALTGTTFEVRARRIIVAAGVWSDRLESVARGENSVRVRPSKGVHLVFPRSVLPMADAAAFIPDAEHRRMLFVVPWLEAVIVGTTDSAYDGDIDHPTLDRDDLRYCLDAVNFAFDMSLDPGDVAGAYAGLRPLVAGKAGATADLSRRHAIYEIAPGIVGITGGKLTTYRRMAEEVVDGVVDVLGNKTKSRTRRLRLGSSNVHALKLAVERRARRMGLGEATVANLVRCYGDRALSVLDVAADGGLEQPLVPDLSPIAAEAAYCVRHEMTVHLSDLLARRTRLSLIDRAGGAGPRSAAAEVMGDALGWPESIREQQVSAHRQEVEAERGVESAREPATTTPPSTRAG